MSDKNLFGHVALIVLVVALAAFEIWPPNEWSNFPRSGRLKGGIDLAGGTSLLYEIDTTGLEEWQKANLAERVMSRLKNRVDPQGQRNLVWRPMGQNRLEIQMPRPPKELAERRQKYETTREAIRVSRVERTEIEAALSRPESERQGELMKLVRGVPEREGLFRQLADAKAKLDKVPPPTTQAAESAPTSQALGFDLGKAWEDYLQGMAKVADTNINLERLQDVLALGKQNTDRQTQLVELKKQHKERSELIDQLAESYDQWAATKGPLEDATDLMRLLRGQGVLEFRILAQPDPENSSNIQATNVALREPIQKYADQLAKYGPRPRPDDKYRWFKLGKPDEFRASGAIVREYMAEKYVLANDQAADSALLHDGKWALKRALPDRDRMNRPSVSFTLDAAGGNRFEQLTSSNIGKPLCILLDDVAMSAPNIQSTIRDQGQITGDFTQDDIIALCNTLEAGSLDARLKETPLSIKTVGPSLGEANRHMGIRASVLSLVLILAFLAVYYLYGGVIAGIALMLNMLITIGIMAMIQGTFTLQGIAGLVLSLGMAVDANVLIHERIREEQARGISLKMAAKLGYDRAFWPIFDGNLTAIMTAVILGYIGTEEIKGFALTLGLGVAVSMFTALFVTRQFFAVLVQPKVSRVETVRCWGGTAILAGAAAVVFGLGALFNKREAWGESVIIAFAQFLATTAVVAVVIVGLIWLIRQVAIGVGSHRTNRMPMFQLLRPLNVDWMSKQPYFWAASGVMTLGGLLLFAFTPDEQLLDIEFLGGTSAQITLVPVDPAKPVRDADVEEIVKGDRSRDQAAGWLLGAAGAMESAAQSNAAGKVSDGVFSLKVADLSAAQFDALLTDALKDKIVRNGVTGIPGGVRVQYTNSGVTDEQFKSDILAAAAKVRLSAGHISTSARVQAVGEAGATPGTGQAAPQSFEIVTTETNKKLVGEAILAALSQHDKEFAVLVERAIGFKLKTDALAPEGAYPIGVGDPADPNRDLLGSYIGMPSVTYNISRFRGGAAMVFEDLNPPQSIESVNRRVRQMRLQPDYEKFDWRESEVFGLTASGQAVKGSDGKDVATYRSVAIVVNDPSIACFDDEAKWRDKVAGPELKLVQAALSNERSLEKVTQFAPQVASQAAQQAAIALVLSLLAMIAYLWFRFGTMEFGLGAILALIHDVAVALGAVTLTHWIAKTPIGPLLGITEMRIDLSVVAAFLTIVGFSVNDTIVIFDRIRENRGRLGALSPQLINDAINQTFPRTLLTTIIVFLGVIVLYVQGGAGIHAFAFTMLIGCLIGNYTTMAIGVPILYRPGVMRAMLGIVVAVFAIGMVIGAESYAVRVAMIIVAVLALAALAYWQYQLRGRSAGAPATKPA